MFVARASARLFRFFPGLPCVPIVSMISVEGPSSRLHLQGRDSGPNQPQWVQAWRFSAWWSRCEGGGTVGTILFIMLGVPGVQVTLLGLGLEGWSWDDSI